MIAHPEKHQIKNKKAKIPATVVSKRFCLALLFVCCFLEKGGKFKICYEFEIQNKAADEKQCQTKSNAR